MNDIIHVADQVAARFAHWLLGLCILIGPAAADTWVLTTDSRLGFVATVEGEPAAVQFTGFDVRPAIDASGAPVGFDVSVDLRTVDSGDPELDDTLRATPWFDTQTHPQARFRSRAVGVRSGGGFRVQGDLSLNGVERTLEIPFTWRSTSTGVEMDGTVAIDRHQFGIGPDAEDAVAGEVTVSFALAWRLP